MPLSKRVLEGCHAYANSAEVLLEDTSAKTVLSDVHMCASLGVLHQIGYLSKYCFEIFDDLVSLADDVRVRIEIVAKRTDVFLQKLESVEAEVYDYASLDGSNHIVNSIENVVNVNSVFVNDLGASAISASEAKIRFLGDRDSYIPEVLTQSTNCRQVKATFSVAAAPPQLWKVENAFKVDCMASYSNPGYFFNEWLRVEQERQAMRLAESRREKDEKKQQKIHRRKLRAMNEKQQRKKSILEFSRSGDVARDSVVETESINSDEAPKASSKKHRSKKDKKKSRDKAKKKASKKDRKRASDDSDESEQAQSIDDEIASRTSDSSSAHSSASVDKPVPSSHGKAGGPKDVKHESESPPPSVEKIKNKTESDLGHKKDHPDDKSSGVAADPVISKVVPKPVAVAVPPKPKGAFGFFGSLFGSADEPAKVDTPIEKAASPAVTAPGNDAVKEAPDLILDSEDATGLSSIQLARARARAAKLKAKKEKEKESIFDDIGTDNDIERVSEIKTSKDSRSQAAVAKAHLPSTSQKPDKGKDKDKDKDKDSEHAVEASEDDEKDNKSSSSAESSSSEEESSSEESSSEDASEDASKTSSDSSSSAPRGANTRQPKAIPVSRRRSSVSTADTAASDVSSSKSDPPAPVARPPPPAPGQAGSRPPPPAPTPAPPGVRGPPPPPPAPFRPRLASALGSALRGNPQVLKKVTMEEPKPDTRLNLLNSIKTGGVGLKSVGRPSMRAKPAPRPNQNSAIAAILSNRSKIAGDEASDSSGNDSDSDYSF